MPTNSDLPLKKGNTERGKKRVRECHLIASGEMEKGKEEIQTIKVTGPTITDKPIRKIPIRPKEKGIVKDSKAKAKAKASHDTGTGRTITTKMAIKKVKRNQRQTNAEGVP